jgi:hypothetical protein
MALTEVVRVCRIQIKTKGNPKKKGSYLQVLLWVEERRQHFVWSTTKVT